MSIIRAIISGATTHKAHGESRKSDRGRFSLLVSTGEKLLPDFCKGP
jgi:hypothetical protein